MPRTHQQLLEYKRAWRKANRAKENEYARRWRAKNHEKWNAYTAERYHALKAIDRVNEPEVCEICKGYPKTVLDRDHCHKSGKFRGYLCRRCNVLLGQVQDDPEILRNMILYLEKHNAQIFGAGA